MIWYCIGMVLVCYVMIWYGMDGKVWYGMLWYDMVLCVMV